MELSRFAPPLYNRLSIPGSPGYSKLLATLPRPTEEDSGRVASGREARKASMNTFGYLRLLFIIYYRIGQLIQYELI